MLLLYLLGILIVCIGFFISSTQASLKEQSFADLLQTSHIIENSLSVSGVLNTQDPSTLQGSLLGLSQGTHTRITLIQEDGIVIGDTDKAPELMNDHSDRPEIYQALLDGKAHSIIRKSPTLGIDMLYVARQIDPESLPDDSQRIVLRVAMPYTAIQGTYPKITLSIIIGALLIVLLSVLILLFLHNRIERPLDEVAKIAIHYTNLGFDEMIPHVPMPFELERVSTALREMSRELQRQFTHIQRQRDELQAVLDCMDEGVIIIDRNGLIQKANPSAHTILTKISNRPIKNRLYNQFLQDKELSELIEPILAKVTSEVSDRDSQASVKEPVERTHKIDVTIGTRRFQVYAVAVNHKPDPIILLVFNDITTLMHLEQVRKDFVANVSHELKTPITSIKGFSETLLQTGLAPDDPRSARFLQIIHSQTERMQSIIDDLLTLSMLDQKHLRLEDFKEVDALSIISESIKLCTDRPNTNERKIRVDCDTAIMIRCNPVLIEQALVNLLENAIKYSDPSTPITISCERVDDECRILVIDEGFGIPKREIHRIFERFYRVDKGRSRDKGGTGLGLSIVRHVALQHGGRVEVSSVEGKGSTFSLHIPDLVH